jgi:WD40 repeat protein
MPVTESTFYVSGGTLRPDAPSYVERQADSDLFHALQHGEFCYVLTSRQMGKSSLMARTAARLREHGAQIVVLDLSAMGENLTVEQWSLGLLGVIGRRLNLEDELDDFWFAHDQIGPLRRFMQAVEEVVLPNLGVQVFRCSGVQDRQEASVLPEHLNTRTPEHPCRLVLFIDEIDTVRSLPFSTDEFFAAIRECYNRRTEEPVFERLTFCLLGVATPSDLIRDVRVTPFNIGRRIELNDFTEAEAAPLRVGLELGGPESLGRQNAQARRLLQRILYWTNGHPYLTQRLCQAVADDASVTSAAGVDRLCEDLFLSPRARERDDNLLFVRERLLRSEADLASLLDLYGQVRAGKRVAVDDTNQLVSLLRLSGITEARRPTPSPLHPFTPASQLTVRNRIYERVFDREWVALHMPDAEVRRQHAAYRRGLVRATSMAGAVLAVVGALALTAVRQTDIAQKALKGRDQANASLLVSLRKEKVERTRADENAEQKARLAEEREKALQDALAQKQRADQQTRIARRQAQIARENAERAEHERGHAAQEAARAHVARQLADRRAREAIDNLYYANMNLIQSDWEKGNVRRILGLLAETRDYPGRGFEWGYWNRLCHLDLRTLTGHAGGVNCVSLSPDSRRIVTGSDDSTVKVWDAQSGRQTLTLTGHTGAVRCVRFSPDGRRVVTSSDDKTARVWDAEDGHETLTLTGFRLPVLSVGFSPDARYIVTGAGNAGKVWDAQTGREALLLMGHLGVVCSVSYSPDGRRIVTASGDLTAKVWDAESGHERLTLKGHTNAVFSASYSPDGRYILTAGADSAAKAWDAKSGRELLTLNGHAGAVNSACFSPDGRRILTGGRDATAKIWDAATGRELFTLKGHSGALRSVTFSPDGRQVVTGSEDKTAKVWDPASGHEMLSLTGHTLVVNSARFSLDGRRIVTGSKDTTAKVWDAQSGQDTLTLAGHAGPIFSVSFSPDGRRILTGSGDKTVKVWDAASGREILTLKGHAGIVSSVSFSPDGRRVLTGSYDGTAKLWDAANGRELLTLKGQFGYVIAASFSPDGRRILTGGGDGTAKVWDAANGRAQLTLHGHTDVVMAVSFSPDGRRLLTGSRDNLAKVWNAANGRETLTLTGHTNNVNSVSFSPDGQRILTGGGDRTAKVWDAVSGRETLTLKHSNAVTSAWFSPDGRRIVTGSFDSTAKVWDGAN